MRDPMSIVFGPKACRKCGRDHYPGACPDVHRKPPETNTSAGHVKEGGQEAAFTLTVVATADGHEVRIDHPMGSDAWTKARDAMEAAHAELGRHLAKQEECPAKPNASRLTAITNRMYRDEEVAVAARNHERIGSEATKAALAAACETWRRERSPFPEHRALSTPAAVGGKEDRIRQSCGDAIGRAATEAGDAGAEPLHLMHSLGRKCDHCGRMTWPGMAGAAPRWTRDRTEWADSPDRCSNPPAEVKS